MYYLDHEDVLTSDELRNIRAAIKADRSYGRNDYRRIRRKMRNELTNARRENGNNGMFSAITKPGKFISDTYTSSRDYKYAYGAKRAEIEFYARAWDY